MFYCHWYNNTPQCVLLWRQMLTYLKPTLTFLSTEMIIIECRLETLLLLQNEHLYINYSPCVALNWWRNLVSFSPLFVRTHEQAASLSLCKQYISSQTAYVSGVLSKQLDKQHTLYCMRRSCVKCFDTVLLYLNTAPVYFNWPVIFWSLSSWHEE